MLNFTGKINNFRVLCDLVEFIPTIKRIKNYEKRNI